jgi:Family of unknown function (DUF5682)
LFTTFGIRHHGPGSAKSLRSALKNMQPDIVLIEGPPGAEKLIEFVGNEELKPPVSILIYNPKDLKQAAYFPFAEFSPEWQAMKFGLKQGIPIRFIDLPQSVHFTLNKLEKENPQLSFQKKENGHFKKITEEETLLQKDPLAYAARLSGYTDSERWWEVMFEKEENPEDIFPAIIDLMTALRGKVADPPPRELMREAHMRNAIRKAQKEGFQNIAVVCGAWHAPVLQNIDLYKSSADNAVLRGIKKTNTKATWVPWSYDRLSNQNGYRAGVISPAYYQLLFGNRKEVVIRWMSKVARLFRKKDLDASSAHIIEAIRLAETLATMRNLTVPGIDEMYEAAVSIFCEGHHSKMEIINKKLIVGDQIGKVSPKIPLFPLQQDLEKAIKSARLTKEKNSTEAVDKKLDLRTPSNLAASHLLHRLELLGIKWGKQKKTSRFNTGNFSEIWKLKWKPDFAINIIEAGMWGNTVYSATSRFVMHKANEVETLPKLTELVESTLNADLNEIIGELIYYLQDLSALTKDVQHLMDALPALVNAIRYGSTRKLDVASLGEVIDKMIPRICISLPNACVSIDEEASKSLFEKLLLVNQSINILNRKNFNDLWYKTLNQITALKNVNGILRGSCSRILFDKEIIDLDESTTRMRYSLSKGNDSMDAALWLEGFLFGSGLLLIHNPVLWKVLDDWISELPMENFQELLPLLRRTFSEFSHPERQKMMALVKRGRTEDGGGETEEGGQKKLDFEKAKEVISTVQMLLGIE